MKFWTGNDTPVIPNSLTLNTQWLNTKYRDHINGVFNQNGELSLFADTIYSNNPATCTLEGKKTVNWGQLRTIAKLEDALKFGQDFEYTYKTYNCRKETIIKNFKAGSLDFNFRSMGGCDQMSTDTFFSVELQNATTIYERELCTWDRLFADCLVPPCGAPADNVLLTVLLVIGTIILVGFVVFFLIWAFIYRKPKEYDSLN